MENEEEVEVCFLGDENILEFINAVDEEKLMKNEVGEAAIDVSRDFASYLFVESLTKEREVKKEGIFHHIKIGLTARDTS